MKQRIAEVSDIVKFFTVQVERGFIIRSAETSKVRKTKILWLQQIPFWV